MADDPLAPPSRFNLFGRFEFDSWVGYSAEIVGV
ncbi:hypothetical protein TorRG33x02_117980 [Trema orientale]|uniref:Uncharacterized protein n=1 Tax=Trema orientale TaxID=63057 RepID=A0A2P5F3V5_TREOI|nr:hypothetical protein TorRG33x02_117980 [Trema orientale]